MDDNKHEIIKWNSDARYALGPYKLLTQSIGIWPLDHFGIIVFLQVFVILLIQCLVTIIFIHELITKGNCDLITDVVDALSLVAVNIMATFKMIVPLINKKRMHFIIKSIIKDWTTVCDKKSKKIMLKYAFAGRIFLYLLMIGSNSLVIGTILGNPPTTYKFSSDQISDNATVLRNIPFGANCWVSTSMSMSIYFGYYGLIVVHCLISSIINVGSDSCMCGIALHVCGQLNLLYTDMESLDGKKNFFSLRKQINQLSQRYAYLIKLANAYQGTLSLIVLLQVATNMFVISISGVLLLWGLETGNNDFIISALVRILLLFCELFVYSFIGESLSTQFGSLKLAIYNCSWYEMSPLLAKDLLFIMMKANYAFHLTAGKICYMNLSSFTNFAKMMFSYFSFLRLIFRE
ncbi:GSCOCT00013813001.3-RA-CDS, partial [Cotesia congregata]